MACTCPSTAQPQPRSASAEGSALLSKRGQASLARPPLLKCGYFDCMYHPCLRAGGVVPLGTAENSLLSDWLVTYYNTHFQLSYSDLSYGTSLSGSTRLYEAIGALTRDHFGARERVRPEHIVTGCGVGAVLDQLVACLADPGDVVLVARPFYNGFVASFDCRANVSPVGVVLERGSEASDKALDAFERALLHQREQGKNVRAIVLSNPNNPLGFCYSRETLEAYCRFCEKHDLHLISDEIYALSTWSSARDSCAAAAPPPQPFVSVLSLDLARVRCSPARVHCVIGSSKDWGSNGLRIGALISQHNPALVSALESACLLMKVSSAADATWCSLLLNLRKRDEYITLNQAALREAYDYATTWLESHAIPYRPSSAGHFVFCDFRKFLPALGDGFGEWDREGALADKLVAHGVNLARGAAYGHTEPGWFRLTFTLRADLFELGLRRLESALALPETVAVSLVRQSSLTPGVSSDEDEDITRSLSQSMSLAPRH